MKKNSIVLLLIAAAISISTTVGASVFPDTDTGEYGRAVDNLAMYGIISGRSDGLFCPDDPVTRSEFAKMAVLAANIDTARYGSSLFYDVDQYHWANGYIDAAAKNKLIMGYPGGAFHPDDFISYAEAVTVILRMLDYGTDAIGNNYPAAYLEKAYDLGITDGLIFDPYAPIDRKNTALMISRALMTEKRDSEKKLIEQSDFTLSDECVILPGYLVSSNEVSTSDGIYTTLIDTTEFEGKRVKLVLDKDKKVLAVIPVSGNTETMTVRNITGSDISYTSSGVFGILRPDDSARVYFQNSEYAFSSIKSEIKPGMKMIVCTNDRGKTDYLIFSEQTLNGPYIVNNGLADTGINTDGKYLMKNGSFIDEKDIERNSVVYYDDEFIYVYDNKVTGVYEKALPYKSDIKSITLSGSEYETETRSAAYSLENTFAINDYVTLLLGKDGKIVGVLAAADAGEKYPIVSILSNAIVYIKDGKLNSITAENNWRINRSGSETTFGAIKNTVFENALLTVFRKSDGSFDYGVIDEFDLKGPLTVSGGIDGLFDFDKSTLRVIRDGSDANISDIKPNDIVYYSDIQNTVYSYCDSELGVFEEAYPSKANAHSIKLSGKVYEIETHTVLDKL
ncbi:MAG: S-layer homology domain-containing protein, partial [Oscillospiraceae bacterium]|nr:S-layer homology domain-containing protein [Oscillospiraceae bacterium]